VEVRRGWARLLVLQTLRAWMRAARARVTEGELCAVSLGAESREGLEAARWDRQRNSEARRWSCEARGSACRKRTCELEGRTSVKLRLSSLF